MDANNTLKNTLGGKTRDDLHIIARRLQIQGYSKLKKDDLISAIIEPDDKTQLAKSLSVTWWDRYHNHVYGGLTEIGVVLTIAFFFVQYQYLGIKPDKPNEGV